MIGKERQKRAVICLVLSVIFISIYLSRKNESNVAIPEVSQQQSTETTPLYSANLLLEPPDAKEEWLKTQPKVFQGIYLREAYRVADNQVRFAYLQKNDSPIKLKAKTVNSDWQPVEHKCCYNQETCLDMAFCAIASRLGTFKLENMSEKVTEIHVASEFSEEYTIVPVKDVRVSDTYDHQLGVCVIPMVYYTDWTLLVQFFESWIAQGATKFYIYLNSYTWQTKRVIDFYKKSLGDSLELIEWSDVPVAERHKGSYDTDPNAQIFRQGATAVMQDCMMRARSHVKYMANTDLDDLPIAKDFNIPKALDVLMKKYPDAAQFQVDWYWSEIPVMWDNINKLSDVKLNFNELKIIDSSNVPGLYRIAKKIFHRPERVMLFDMHTVYQNEISAENKDPYRTIQSYKNPDLYFLHPRRFQRNFVTPANLEYNTSYNMTDLKELNNRMNRAFSKRLEQTNYSDVTLSPWVIEARRTFRDLETCRREAYGIEINGLNKRCGESSGACGAELSSAIHFEKTTQTWIDIAHVGNFHAYTKKT